MDCEGECAPFLGRPPPVWNRVEDAADHKQVVATIGHAYYQEYLAETARLLANNDQRGFYRHLIRLCWEGKRQEAKRSSGTRMAQWYVSTERAAAGGSHTLRRNSDDTHSWTPVPRRYAGFRTYG